MVERSRIEIYGSNGLPDLALAALAHPARRDMLRRTLAADLAISDLAWRYDMSFAGVSKHVAILERAGLVTKRPAGREQMVRADPEVLAAVLEMIEHLQSFWEERPARVGP